MTEARCAIYARYSSDSQREASIEDQLRVCRARAEQEGWAVVEVLADAAISGSTTQRPGYQALLARLRAGRVNLVLTESLDRLSRDQEHIAAFYKHAAFAGVRVVTLAEGEINELHIGLKGTMGALYLKDLADKTRRGLEGRVRAGRCVGRAPYGYRAIRGQLRPDGEPERGLREPDPAEAAVVRRIFAEYASGRSPRAIARTLNAEGVPGPTGGPWYDATLRGKAGRGSGLLRNPLYAGRMVWNRHRAAKDPLGNRAVRKRNPVEAFVEVEVPELRLVEPALWAAVQTRLGRESAARDQDRGPRFWEARRPKHLLSGKVFCSVCGHTFKAAGKDYLACLAAKDSTCRNHARVRRAALEQWVLDALGTRLMDPALAAEFAAAFTEEWTRLASEAKAGAGSCRAELAEVERKIANLTEAIADGARSAALRARLDLLEQRQAELEAALHTQPAASPHVRPNLGQLYRQRVAELRDALVGEGACEAREAARALISRIVISPPDGDRGPPGIELIGELAAMLQAGGVVSTTPDADGGVAPILAVLGSVKAEQGGRRPPRRAASPSLSSPRRAPPRSARVPRRAGPSAPRRVSRCRRRGRR
jgi:site-specific DNA recombinase